MDMPAAAPPAIRHANGRFGPGNPGRRLGSRNRVSQRLIWAILQDFEANQELIFERLHHWDHLQSYVALLLRLLPRQIDVNLPDVENLSECEIARVVGQARAVLDRIERGDTSLIELEAVLHGDGLEAGQ